MTRGRKVTERPHSACPSLKEKRWNTHTDLPSVNRVCKRGREIGKGESGPEMARLRESPLVVSS